MNSMLVTKKLVHTENKNNIIAKHSSNIRLFLEHERQAPVCYNSSSTAVAAAVAAAAAEAAEAMAAFTAVGAEATTTQEAYALRQYHQCIGNTKHGKYHAA